MEEGNILFNDALDTFYLRLYGAGNMVKDHSDSERGNPLPPHGLLFLIMVYHSQVGHFKTHNNAKHYNPRYVRFFSLSISRYIIHRYIILKLTTMKNTITLGMCGFSLSLSQGISKLTTMQNTITLGMCGFSLSLYQGISFTGISF